MISPSCKLLFVILAAMGANQVVCQCQHGTLPGNSGRAIINSTCINASGIARSNDGVPFIYLTSGDIGDGNECKVYDGEDSTGELLGIFTRFGYETGAVRSKNDSLFFDCNLSNPHQDLIWSYQLVLVDDCGGRYFPGDFPNVTSPEDPFNSNVYPHCTFCVWEFDSTQGCNYTFDLSRNTILNDNDFIFINWGPDNIGGHGDAVRYGNVDTFFFASPNTQAKLSGSRLRLMFVSDGSGPTAFGFDMGVSTDGDCTCGAWGVLPGNSGKVTIDASCEESSGIARSDDGVPFIYLTSGDIGDGNECRVYDGEDNTGELLGIFTGFGNAAGAVRSNGNSLFYECNLSNPHEELVWSYQLVLVDDCGGRVTAGDHHLITSPVDPSFVSAYPHCTFCVWEFDNPQGCSYTFHLDTATVLNGHDYVFVNWGPDNVNPGGVAVRFGSPGFFSAPDNVTTSLTGTHLRVMFVSDGSGPTAFGFQMELTPGECPPPDQLQCGEVTSIYLNEERLRELNATSQDILYIAPSEGIKPEDVDPSCVTTSLNPHFVFNITQCVPVAQESEGVIKLTYIVWNQKYLDPSAPVQRYFVFCVNFTCEYETNLTVSSSELDSEIRKIGFDTEAVEAEFQVALDLYDSDSFSEPLADDSMVTVPEYVYAEVRMSDIPASADNFHVEMTSCWGTITADANTSPIYPIIEASCPVSNPFDPAGSIVMIRNSQPIYGQFKFRSFVWTNVTEQTLYVHCDVTICDTEAGDCPDECEVGRRRRRSVAVTGKKQILSAGPIFISSKSKSRPAEIQNEELEDQVRYVDVVDVLQSIQESRDEDRKMFAVIVLVLVVAACGAVYHFATK